MDLEEYSTNSLNSTNYNDRIDLPVQNSNVDFKNNVYRALKEKVY